MFSGLYQVNAWYAVAAGISIILAAVYTLKMIQKVLLSPVCLEKPFFYKFLRLDSGLISAKCKFKSFWCWIEVKYFLFLISCADDTWKIHRRSLNYSFNLKILQTFIPTFIENSQKLVEDLSVNIGKAKEFNMLDYTTKSALNMICGELESIRR